MFSVLRNAATSRASFRAFSTSSAHADLSKLTLIGNLGRDPELKQTKNNTNYVTYTVATSTYAPNAADPAQQRTTTWHKVFCFSESSQNYLMNLKKGSKVYVEANFELREPDAGADPESPQGQRQIFLRHNNITVISAPKPQQDNESPEEI
ncbi:hypothetical protein C8J56DRAFT_1047596 [Mycena floridula]|nr:hypothetical protein C8J56DRAFT_1047596 [Mycena floridula]